MLVNLAHPCIGAFIGYLTNKVAIRMLFRPLRPWYLFGVRIPMTPGVIPGKREQLAINIGEMVGRHLLTSKDIGAAISGEPFQEHLAGLIDRKVQEILKKDRGALPEVIPERFKAYFQIGVKTLKYRLGEGVNSYLASSGFEEKLTISIADSLDALGERDLNSLMSAEDRKAVYLLFDQVVGDFLQNSRTETWLAQYLVESVRSSAVAGGSLADILPQQLVTLLQEVIRKQSRSLMQQMGSLLADPVLKKQVVQGILGGVDHFLDTLGPVGAMAKGFLETDSLEPKIDEYLGKKEGDLIAWLQSTEVQERMTVVLVEHVDGLLQRRLSDLLETMGEARLAALCQMGAEQLLAVFRTEGTMTGLSAMLHVGMEDLLESGHRRLDDLAARFFPGESGENIRATILKESVALFRSNKTERLVNSMINAMVDTLLTRPIGKLYDFIPHGVRQGMAEYVVLIANRMLLQEVPGVVESLNIQRVVTDKVDSLDLMQLERLLLSIMEEQFKYINLFGALLGFCIGLINLLLVKLI